MSSKSDEWSAADALALERHIMANDPVAIALRVAILSAARTQKRLTIDDLTKLVKNHLPVNGKVAMSVRETLALDFEFCWEDPVRMLYFVVGRTELAVAYGFSPSAIGRHAQHVDEGFKREYLSRFWEGELEDE
jgi:hypothetical protein